MDRHPRLFSVDCTKNSGIELDPIYVHIVMSEKSGAERFRSLLDYVSNIAQLFIIVNYIIYQTRQLVAFFPSILTYSLP